MSGYRLIGMLIDDIEFIPIDIWLATIRDGVLVAFPPDMKVQAVFVQEDDES